MIRIARIKPRAGGDEEPWKYARGYQLADPALGREWHHAKNAIYVPTIQEAADRIEHDRLALRMGRIGLRASLVRPSGLQITR